jgi:hypothetical protein
MGAEKMRKNFHLQPSTDPLPPAEVRFLEARVEPWPDGRRIRVHITVTPFQQRPNIIAQLLDFEGSLLSQADIIETMDARLVFTMHLRSEEARGPFHLKVALGYQDIGKVDQREIVFAIDGPQD